MKEFLEKWEEMIKLSSQTHEHLRKAAKTMADRDQILMELTRELQSAGNMQKGMLLAIVKELGLDLEKLTASAAEILVPPAPKKG